MEAATAAEPSASQSQTGPSVPTLLELYEVNPASLKRTESSKPLETIFPAISLAPQKRQWDFNLHCKQGS